jgi:2-polyprenyl-3-methyl-5-hydroxy-6-metoxy-1,4-benzoquinol methylase
MPRNHTERIPLTNWQEKAAPVARYQYATRFVQDCRVLDAACGIGYGTKILAGQAVRVWGVDYASEAARTAQEHFKQPNNAFVIADLSALPLKKDCFDVVISLETLEHLTSPEACLLEFRRVLCDGGILVVSTPNGLITKHVNGKPANPYHVFEYKPQEFATLLDRYFFVMQIVGQHRKHKVAASAKPQEPRLIQRKPFLGGLPEPIKKAILRYSPRRILEKVFFSLRGYHLKPEPEDYIFVPEQLDTAQVLIGICQSGNEDTSAQTDIL